MTNYDHLKITPLLKEDMPLLFIGINPSSNPKPAHENHFYGTQTNLFWTLFTDCDIIPNNHYSALDDRWIFKYYDIGFTNLVSRPTSKQEEIKKNEYELGVKELKLHIERYRPKAICFVGTTIYSIFNNKFASFKKWGPQSNYIYRSGNTYHGSLVFVIPSTSNLGVTYSRQDKARSFKKLKQFLDRNNINISM